MSLLDDVKVACRVSSSATDVEVELWIAAAQEDLLRVGVREELVVGASSALVKAAVVCYAKANYGYDVEERAQFQDSYRRIVCDLLNSDANMAAGDYDG